MGAIKLSASTDASDSRIRAYIAMGITSAAVVGVVVISWVAIGFAPKTERPEMARLVFASVLPLLGTWVGTVLAFYFARENLQAASKSTLETLKLAGTFTEETQVTAAMTPLGKINPIRRVATKTAADTIKLKALNAAMVASENSRVPILTNDDKALFVVHEPDLDKYAQKKRLQASELADDDTVGELRKLPLLKRAVETFVAVGETATLGDARREMLSSPECKDVFVTDNGKTTGKVMGWLTNSDLARSN